MLRKLPYKVYSSNSKCAVCQPIIHHLCGSDITSLQAWAQIRTVVSMFSGYSIRQNMIKNLGQIVNNNYSKLFTLCLFSE